MPINKLPVESSRRIYSEGNFVVKEISYSDGLSENAIDFSFERARIARAVGKRSLINDLVMEGTGVLACRSLRCDSTNKASQVTKDMLQRLFFEIQVMHSLGFVHGDISRKNILVNKNELHLIDFEPFLVTQDKRGNLLYRATQPYFSDEDKAEETLTVQTDWIGFWSYALFKLNVIEMPQFGPMITDKYGLRRLMQDQTNCSFAFVLDEMKKIHRSSITREYIQAA